MHSVLYVDDEENLLEIGKLFLEDKGDLNVDTTASAIEAIEKIKTRSYDAIVSDYQMPKMDGIEFLKQVRCIFGNIPFILFTGKGREEVAIQAINNGADFYLQKGGDPTAQFAELDHDIRVAVERRKAVDALVESEQRLADIINFLPDATFAIGTNGVVIAWNRAIEEMTGIPAADMLGKGDHEYAIPFYNERRPILIDLVLETEEKISKRDYTITKKEGNVLIAETPAAHPRGIPKILLGKASLLYNRKGEITGAIESIRDITETKRAEDELRAAYEQLSATEEELRTQYETVSKNERALRESEKAYRTIFDHTGSATIQVEEDTTISMVNSTFETLTGYSRNEIEGIRKWTEFVVREDLEQMVRFHTERRKPEGRPPEQYEFRLITKLGEFRDILLTVGIIPGTKKTVATLFDQTERKKMELALRESEATFRTLTETSIVSICVFGQKILYVNPAGEALTGYSRDELLKMDFWSFIHPDFRDLVRDRGQRRQKGEAVPSHYEVKIVRKDGEERWVDASTTVFQYEGQPALLSVQVDITERKMAEAALQQASLVVENSPVILFRWKAAEGWPVAYVSNNVIQFGYRPEEFLSGTVSFSSIVYPGDLERVSAEVQENSASGVGQFTQEYRIVTKDGNIRWVDDRTVIERDSDGRITHYQGIVIDISERKLAEKALRSSEENFRNLVENAPDAIYIQTNNRFVYLNAAAVHLFGASSPEELLGTNAYDRIHPSFHELIHQRVRSLTVELKSVELIDEIYVRMDGTPVDVEVAAVPFRYEGKNGALIMFRDITRRKQAESELRAAYEQLTATEGELRRQYRELAENEQELRQSEARYRNVVEVQTELISRFRPDGTHVFVNEAYCRYFGKSREEIIGRTFIPDIPVEDGVKVKLHFATLTPSHPVDSIEHRIIMADGEVRWQRWTDRAIFDEKGNVTEFQSVGQDTTDRKRAEEALRESEERYRVLIENASVAIGVVQNKKFILVNKKATEVSGYSQEEMLELPFSTFVHPDDLEYVNSRHIKTMNGQKIREPYCFRIITKSGFIRWLDVKSVRIFWNEKPTTLNFYIDITEQKKAEEALRQSEEKYRSILDKIQDVLYRTDMQGILTMMSPAGARSLGYNTPDEVRGLDIARDIYADPEKRKEFLAALAEKGAVDNYPVTLKLRDGSHRYATASSHFYYDAEGTPLGIEGIIHDITDLKRAEDALRQANRQLNLMTSITRHDILNKVTIILSYLTLARKKVTAPLITQYIDKLETETKAIRSQIEFTRVYEELGTHEPQWQDLDTVIPRLHVPADISLAADVQGVEVYADAMLEKVFYNLLDNTIRHGEKVSEIRVYFQRASDSLIIIWEDNGVGIPLEEKERICERGFGKHNGFGLFLSCEILTITGLTIRETGEPGKGARFEISVPKGAYRFTGIRGN
jgi:PAS domain S-box-containing protein